MKKAEKIKSKLATPCQIEGCRFALLSQQVGQLRDRLEQQHQALQTTEQRALTAERAQALSESALALKIGECRGLLENEKNLVAEQLKALAKKSEDLHVVERIAKSAQEELASQMLDYGSKTEELRQMTRRAERAEAELSRRDADLAAAMAAAPEADGPVSGFIRRWLK